jgi:hypothetical protein
VLKVGINIMKDSKNDLRSLWIPQFAKYLIGHCKSF